MEQKVFCLGFQKTGTTSLGAALETLGYQTCGYNHFRDLASEQNFSEEVFRDRIFSLSRQFDAFKDTPWPLYYREFDQMYPGSKFILVIRDTDRWIDSVTNDFGSYPNAIHQYIYNEPFPLGNEDAYIARYERHNVEVKEYFKGREDDFICLYMNRGEVNWESLCSFLGKEVPHKPWPHANTRRNKKLRMSLARIANFIKRGGRRAAPANG